MTTAHLHEDKSVCVPRYLPPEKWAQAADVAASVEPSNRTGAPLPDPTTPEGGRIALEVRKRWNKKTGVHLTVGFLDNPPADLRARILSHMNAWNKTANVTFVESHTDPQVRIARMTAATAPEGMDGYWSYIGTDILTIPKDEPTMNLEAFSMDTPESEFIRVVRHETGHTLGFPHEHMRKELVDRLDREKTIAYFMKTQGWKRREVIDQVLTPLEESSLLGTPNPDPKSIMCYQIPGILTKDGKAIIGGEDIDASDFEFAGHVYAKPGH